MKNIQVVTMYANYFFGKVICANNAMRDYEDDDLTIKELQKMINDYMIGENNIETLRYFIYFQLLNNNIFIRPNQIKKPKIQSVKITSDLDESEITFIVELDTEQHLIDINIKENFSF